MEADRKENNMHTLGTVVKLQGESDFMKNNKLVIVERFVQDPDKRKRYYDYKGTYYPVGAINNNDRGILFNEEDIKIVLYYGYKDEQDEEFVGVDQKELAKKRYKKSNSMKKTDRIV